MEPETEVVQAPEPKAEPQPSLQERMAKSVEEAWGGATTESATATTPSADEPPVAAQAGAEPVAGEEAPAAQSAAPGEDVPFTPEQLKDTAFWGGLDKDGWAKAERLHPVETKLVKAAQAAASRIVNAARKDAPAEPAPPVTQTAGEPELSAEQQAILDDIDLGTPMERLKAFQKLALMTVEEVPAIKSTRAAEQRQALMDGAYAIAVNGDETLGLPAFPQLDQLSEDELKAAYDSDPEAKAMVGLGTPQAIAIGMRRAGQLALAQKAANDAKFNAEQEKLRRNANTPVSNAVKPGSGGPIPQAPQSPIEFVRSEWNKVAVKANQ